jgi:N-acetylmuramoyl-L-alanine amidase
MTSWIVLLVACLAVAPPPTRSVDEPAGKRHFAQVRRVMLDPGHGGVNGGALSATGTLEKDATLALVLALKDHLASNTDLEVVLTRDADDSLTLPERVALANRVGADLFLSFHLNSTDQAIASGVEVYTRSEDPSDEDARRVAEVENLAPEEGQGLLQVALRRPVQRIVHQLEVQGTRVLADKLAGRVQRSLVKGTRLLDRGVKSAPFGVLHGLDMPGVVVELGFLSSPEEAEYLETPAYAARMQRAVLEALTRYERDLGR